MTTEEAPIWHYVDKRENAAKDAEMYTHVADLYHEFRPRYSSEMIDLAASELPSGAHVLEIGCGPGTATLPFLERGFRLTCIEPGSGMLNKAKQVCQKYEDLVSFHQMTIQDFTAEDESFDAVLAATSFHWAMDSKGDLIRKCHRLLKRSGKLILLWNLPPEPSEPVRDAVAEAASKPLPFYFGGYSVLGHQQNIRNSILDPVEKIGLFDNFSELESEQSEAMHVSDFVGLLHTFSSNIRLPEKERNQFFQLAINTIKAEFGTSVDTKAFTFLNVSKRL